VSPGREPVTRLAPEASQRLKEVQGGRQSLKLEAFRARAGCTCKGGVGGTQSGLDEGGHDGEDEKRDRQPQGTPETAEGRERGKKQEHQIPLRHERQGAQGACPRMIERLKGRAAPQALVDAVANRKD